MIPTVHPVLPGVACNVDPDILRATLPLFESDKVAAIEWSFDALFAHSSLPSWFADLLTAYSAEGRLIGHGVFFSLFAGHWRPEQQQWLKHLQSTAQQFRFDHLTEHFGFMTGADFHKGAPISIPFNQTTLSDSRL